MDIAPLTGIDTKAAANEGTRVAFVQPDGEPLLNANKEEVGVHVLGRDSDRYTRTKRLIDRRQLERLQKMRGRVLSDEQLDQIEREECELLAAVTTDWFGILDSKGKPTPFSVEGAQHVYEAYPPAKEQANAAVFDRTRFTKAS